jgi:hypothetical protein
MELTELHVLLTSVVLENSPIIKGESVICSLLVTNVEGISLLIVESESGTTVLNVEVVVRVEDGVVAVNISRAECERGAIIPILVTGGTPILTTEVVSAADGAHSPMPITEVSVGAATGRVVGTFKLTAPAIVGTVAILTPAMALTLEMEEITALVTAVTAASEEMPSA